MLLSVPPQVQKAGRAEGLPAAVAVPVFDEIFVTLKYAKDLHIVTLKKKKVKFYTCGLLHTY